MGRRLNIRKVSDAAGRILIDDSLVDKIRHDLRTVSKAQVELAGRLRTFGGEESLSILNQPMQLALTSI